MPKKPQAKIDPKDRWMVVIHYDWMGAILRVERTFPERPMAEFAIKNYLVSGVTILGESDIRVVPPGMLRGISFYDQIGDQDGNSQGSAV